MTMSVVKSVRFPEGLVERLEAEAASRERSFSWLVVKACEERFAVLGSADEDLDRCKAMLERDREAGIVPASPKPVVSVPGVVRASQLPQPSGKRVNPDALARQQRLNKK